MILKYNKAIRRLKNRKIPIIAMTANAFEEDSQAAIAAGMSDHLISFLHNPSPV